MSETLLLEAPPGLQDLLDAMPDAVVALRPDGAVLAMNAAFCEMWNIPRRLRERPTGTRVLWHFLAQVAQPAGTSRLLEAALTSPGEAGERIIAAADGRRLECRHRALRQDGEVTGLLIIMRDVTAPLLEAPAIAASADAAADQVRLQQAYGLLGRQAEQLQLVLQHMSQGIVSVRADGRVTFYNSRLLEILELPESLMLRLPHFHEVEAFQRERGDYGPGDSFFDGPLRDRVVRLGSYGASPYYLRRTRSGRVIEVRTTALPEGGWLRTFADVTEAHRTQELLERSNRLLAVSQAMAHVGGWEVDVSTGSVFWTDEIYRMLEISPAGYTPDTNTARRFLAPEFADRVLQIIEQSGSQAEPFSGELQMITAKGRRIWVHAVGSVVTEAGRPTKRIYTLQDITQRKQAEQEQSIAGETRRRMAQQLDMAVVGATLGLWSLDIPSNKAVLSGEWEAILGMPFDEGPAPQAIRIELVHPDDRDGAREVLRRHLRSGNEIFEYEFRMQHARGHWVWLRGRGRTVEHDAAGRAVRVAGIVKDITAELAARQIARRQHQMLQGIIEGIETGIMINDGSHVVYMNAGFRRLLGYGESHELGSLNIDDVIAAEDRPFTLQRRNIVAAGGRVPLGWIKLVTRTGEQVQTALSLSRIFLGDVPHYIATANRLSEQDMLDVQIRTTQARFERLLVSELEKQQAHIARELHDSLGSELAGVSLMVGSLKTMSPRNTRLQGAVAKVQMQVQSAAGITRALARGLMPVDTHPGAFWNAMEQMASNLSTLRGVPCALAIEGQDIDIPVEVRNHLYRIAQEAITNALRHGKAQHIEIRFGETGDRRYMEVEADGETFDARAAMAAKEQGMAPGETPVKGIGMRSIMARAKTIGGTVEFGARSMAGSCVTVYWPHSLPVTEPPQFL